MLWRRVISAGTGRWKGQKEKLGRARAGLRGEELEKAPLSLPNQGHILHWLAAWRSARQAPDPRFSKFSVRLNHTGILLRGRLWFVRSGNGLRVCISYKHRWYQRCWFADHILSRKETSMSKELKKGDWLATWREGKREVRMESDGRW